MSGAERESLCWRCGRPGTRSCAWDDSKGTTPVAGWTAQVVPWREMDGSDGVSYHVTACPLFVASSGERGRSL